MRLFRNRRRNVYGAPRRRSPWIIVGICAAAALLITIIIGNLLKLWLDDEIYQKLTDGTDAQPKDEPIYQAPTPNVHAYAYSFGEELSALFEYSAASVSLNTPDGQVRYTSDTVSFFNMPALGNANLQQSMYALREEAAGRYGNTLYVSGVFSPQALDPSKASTFYAQTAIDCAVIHEFLEAGGSEILLCNISFDAVDREALLEYVKAVKSAVGTKPLGIAIPLAIAQRADAWELMGELLKYCDFLALDMRASDAPLTDCNYYLAYYDMRLLLSETQTEYIETAQQSLNDLQTIGE